MLASMRTVAIAGWFVTLPAPVGAAQFGASVDVARAKCTTFCQSDGSALNGGDGQPSAFASLAAAPGQAGASAQVDLNGVIGTLMMPTLGAKALGATVGAAGQDYYSFARAVAADGYVYTGATPKSFSLQFLLAGMVSPPAGNFFGDPQVSAAVYLFGAQNFQYRQLLSTILFEDMPPVIAGTEIPLPPTGNPEQVPGMLNFTLQPGESVFLFAHVVASTTGVGTTADGFQTLTFSFVDPTGLVNARLIPEPKMWLLLTIGLGVLGLTRFASWRRFHPS